MQTKKRKIKEGEAFVGMKRMGSQLVRTHAVSDKHLVCAVASVDIPAETEHAGSGQAKGVSHQVASRFEVLGCWGVGPSLSLPSAPWDT